MQQTKKRLGDQLIDNGLITQDQLQIALLEQQATGERIGKIFVRLGFVTDTIIRDVLGSSLGAHAIDLDTIVVDADARALIPRELARQIHSLPISYDAQTHTLSVAMSDTFNIVTVDRIKAQVGSDIYIEPVLAAEAQIETAIDRLYGFELSIDGILEEIESGTADIEDYQGEEEAYSHPMVRLVDALLSDAVKRRASDIHFEPEEGFLRIRYRIDGVLRQIRSLHHRYQPTINVRLKVLSGMNLAESRTPQDGRITRTVGGHLTDFRVATQPTIHGENIVLRILDRARGIIPIEKMGLSQQTLNDIRLSMARPEGIILVTGPTGSGKTTTLYSILNELNDVSVNIMTLEDPVEYPLPMIRQTSLGQATKMDFASGIRSMMRQDPDIILVGEIRDRDTAEMAFQAAMTGHKVLSTLHTNSAVGAFPRLYDIGVKPDVLSGNIVSIVAQRLVRRLCPHCKEAYNPNPLEFELLAIDPDTDLLLYRPKGCTACEDTGYRGRLPIMEVLRIDKQLDHLISRGASMGEIEAHAIANGFSTLADGGTAQVIAGNTTLDEISRIVDLTARVTSR